MALVDRADISHGLQHWSGPRSVRSGLSCCLLAPFFVYPVFLIKMLCFCLFACAFNLLSHTTGLLSFGHAAFFGAAAYVAGHAAKVWGVPFEGAILIGTAAGALPRLGVRLHLDPPAGPLLRHDHAGAGADDLFRCASSCPSPTPTTG